MTSVIYEHRFCCVEESYSWVIFDSRGYRYSSFRFQSSTLFLSGAAFRGTLTWSWLELRLSSASLCEWTKVILLEIRSWTSTVLQRSSAEVLKVKTGDEGRPLRRLEMTIYRSEVRRRTRGQTLVIYSTPVLPVLYMELASPAHQKHGVSAFSSQDRPQSTSTSSLRRHIFWLEMAFCTWRRDSCRFNYSVLS